MFGLGDFHWKGFSFTSLEVQMRLHRRLILDIDQSILDSSSYALRAQVRAVASTRRCQLEHPPQCESW